MKKTGNWLLTCLLLCLSCVFAQAQQANQVSGVVKDSTGHPIPSVTVTVKGKQNATVTDNEGKFALKNVSAGATLVFSSVGYTSQEVKAGFGPLSVMLIAGGGTMEDVVVTAMGIKKQARSLGYAVSTVTAKDITQTGSTNFASALYGKAAGVKINTAPGGASSGVSLQIRGVASVGLSTQPLYVVNGVPIRLYNDLTSGSVSTSNSRISSDGIVDLNPEDIETLTVLKGASATALYGSEAANGVVVITTKKGSKSKGLGVEMRYLYNAERVAQIPDFQNEYGPGYDAQTNVVGFGSTYDGWQTQTDGQVTPEYRAYGQFGPKFDGRTVTYWDGSTRPYVANKNNYKNFFDKGYNSNANIAISNANEKGSYRLSYNRVDYKSIMPGSNEYKNIVTFTGTMKLSDRVSVDLNSTYNNTFTHNRPYVTSNIFGSYNGFFSRFDDMSVMRNRYKTKLGYKYLTYNNTSYDTEENFKYNMRATQLLDYYWTALYNSYDENMNRFINSATLNIKVLDNLNIRGRVGGDLTSNYIADKEHNTAPVSISNSGAYNVTQNTFNTLYGDGLITYAPKVSKDLHLSISGGGTIRKQVAKQVYATTNTGLVTENYFSLNNSYAAVTASSYRSEQYDVAGFGLLDLNYKDFLYIEGTGRYEATSTLPPANNNYFYPSVNAGFILSDVVKMPSFIDYAKLRASYGLVGNHPNLYQANVAYNQSAITYNSASVLYQYSNPSGFGNDRLQSEQKREMEYGLETRLLNNKVAVDFSYYNNKISKMILTQTTAASTGATSALTNAGNILNYGFEASVNVQALTLKNFRWSTGINFAINRNKLLAVTSGLNELVNSNVDGGYLLIKSHVGDALGNIYTHPIATDGKGNAVIDDYGFYTVNTNDYKYVGNGMPKIIGGWSNSFAYKNFNLDVTIDYRFGGKFISIARYYNMGAGQYKESLKYRDAAHGGLAYVTDDANGGDANAAYTLSSGGTRTDGMILKGVTSTGVENTKVIQAAAYYENAYNWETAGVYENAVFDNSYIKMREVAFSYNLPKKLATKIHTQNIQLSLIGRNLFYIWKTLPQGIDPEAGVGTSWLNQMTEGGGTAAPSRTFGVSLRTTF